MKTLLRELKQEENTTTYPEKDIYKVVIEYKNGSESIVKSADSSWVTYDGVRNFPQDQLGEVCSSIAYQFNWE